MDIKFLHMYHSTTINDTAIAKLAIHTYISWMYFIVDINVANDRTDKLIVNINNNPLIHVYKTLHKIVYVA